MTDPILRLESERVSVAPGAHEVLTLTIHNPGNIVEGYDLDVVGEIPLPWVTVTPAFVSVYPQQEATATVMFSPPEGGVAASGTIPFGIRARSRVDANSSAVVEGDIEVGQLLGLQAKLTPVTSTGRWRGRHTISISNWGNSAVQLRIVASDPDEQLGFLVYPETLTIPLGGTATARLKAKTRRPTLRGTPRQLPFEVVAERDPAPPVTGPVSTTSTPDRPVLRGAFAQKPILSRGVVGLAAGALVVALVGGGAAYELSRNTGVSSANVATKTVTTTIGGTPTTITTTITSSPTTITSSPTPTTPSSPTPATTSSPTTSSPTTDGTGGSDGTDGTDGSGGEVALQPGQYIAGLQFFQSGFESNAQTLVTDLKNAGVTNVALILPTDNVSFTSGEVTDSALVYLGPFDEAQSITAAGQGCTDELSSIVYPAGFLPPACLGLQVAEPQTPSVTTPPTT